VKNNTNVLVHLCVRLWLVELTTCG